MTERKRYKGICPHCGGELWICKNMSMENGYSNIGHGSCCHCGAFLHLEWIEDRQEFDAEMWEHYMERFRKKLKKVHELL